MTNRNHTKSKQYREKGGSKKTKDTGDLDLEKTLRKGKNTTTWDQSFFEWRNESRDKKKGRFGLFGKKQRTDHCGQNWNVEEHGSSNIIIRFQTWVLNPNERKNNRSN